MKQAFAGWMGVRGWALLAVVALSACGGGGDGSPDPVVTPPKAQFGIAGATQSEGPLPSPSAAEDQPRPQPGGSAPLQLASPGDTIEIVLSIESKAAPAFAYVQPEGSNYRGKIAVGGGAAKAVQSTIRIAIALAADASAARA